MFKLLHAPRSPFALKVRILVHELGLSDTVEFVVTDPWTAEDLRALNPLCKVPTLVLPDGSGLFDSRVICEFLDEVAEGSLIPRTGPARYRALRLQALGDGLAEATIRRFVERLSPLNDRTEAVVRRQEAALRAGLAALEADAAWWDAQLTIGEVAVAAALMYLSFRSPELGWHQDHPTLFGWYEAFSERPSARATRIVPVA
jgi:glutathione S-transferase